MAELLPVLGSLGGGGALVAVIVYLLGSNRADRAAVNDRLTAAHARADAAEQRAKLAQDDVDAALKRARTAEEDAARLRWELDRLRPPEVPPPPAEGGTP